MDKDELAGMLRLLGKITPEAPDRTFHLNFPDRNLLTHFTENPLLHCLLPGVYTLSELRLLSNEDVTLGKQLIGMFKNLQCLTFGEGIEQDEEFIEFIDCALKTYRGLRFLHFEGPRFKQQQFDMMPDHFQNLKILSFKNDFCFNNLNLDFVPKLKNLLLIKFSFNTEKETMRFLFKNCTHQPDFRLQFNGLQKVCIARIWYGGSRVVRDPPTTDDSDFGSCRPVLVGSTNKGTKFSRIEDAIEFYYSNDLFNTPWAD